VNIVVDSHFHQDYSSWHHLKVRPLSVALRVLLVDTDRAINVLVDGLNDHHMKNQVVLVSMHLNQDNDRMQWLTFSMHYNR
jgi:hypothetical protein